MRIRSALVAAVAALAACGRSAPEGQHGVAALSQTGFTAPLHFDHGRGELLLLADGRALAVGNGGAETYDAAANVWIPTGPMTAYRAGFTAVRLEDGRVLVAGGYDPNAQTAEILDPATGTWTATPPMPKARSGAPAAVLADGRVLFTTSRQPGPIWIPDADILDVATFTWTPTAGQSTRACLDGDAFELPDGRTFFACGSGGEIYQPSSGTFLAVTGFLHTYDVAVQLTDGRILMAGGYGAPCQIFDPATTQLTPTGSMLAPARHHAAAALMPDGTVLVAGGNDGTSTLDSVERYSPANGTWTAMPPLLQRREYGRMVALPSGDALVVGGTYLIGPSSSSGISYDRQAEILPGACIPLTCAAAGASCGPAGDGCGGTLDCGACGSGQVCVAGGCCTPATCASLGASCGSPSDGCGGALSCGACDPAAICTAAHVCCTPITCSGAGAQCGSISDGCGGALSCGGCGAGQVCVGNACVCAPTTCGAQGVACGVIPDGCGATLTCNSCPAGLVCDLAAATCKVPPGQAALDATLRAPACAGEASLCDSGTLLVGRGPLGPEANAPNTLGGSCADGSGGSFHWDESLDRLRVASLDGGSLTAGKLVRIEATVWAYAGFTSDKLDLFFAADARTPSWKLVATLTPPAAGSQVLSATYTLPPGTLQAIRGVFRYGGSAAPCTTGPYDDHDDLVFPVVSVPDTTPPTLALTAPAAGATVSGSVVVSADASDDVGVDRVEFTWAPDVAGATPALIGTDTAAPYAVTWDTCAVPAPASYAVSATAYDGAGNRTTRSNVVTVAIASPTVAISSPASGATVSGAVAITASASDPCGVSRVDFYVDGALVGSEVAASQKGVPRAYQATWDSSSATPGSHALVAVATNGWGRATTSLSVPVTVAAPASPGTAAYSATWRAPACSAVASSCDSGPTLLQGRAWLGPEPNAPNTLGGSCADGTAGRFHYDESIDRLLLATVDGGSLRAGAQARLSATVWAYSTGDVLDVYAAPSAASPAWTFVGTATPSTSGAQTLTVTYTLPTGTVQAVRAVFRWGGTRSPCPTGPYDDKDDLVFAAQ